MSDIIQDKGEEHVKDALVDENSDRLTIEMRAATGGSIFIKLKKMTALSKAFETFSVRTGVSLKEMRFVFDGTAIAGDDTVKKLGMVEGDVIDVMVAQTGGFK